VQHALLRQRFKGERPLPPPPPPPPPPLATTNISNSNSSNSNSSKSNNSKSNSINNTKNNTKNNTQSTNTYNNSKNNATNHGGARTSPTTAIGAEAGRNRSCSERHPSFRACPAPPLPFGGSVVDRVVFAAVPDLKGRTLPSVTRADMELRWLPEREGVHVRGRACASLVEG
jgi:hypothetical protein